MEDSACRLDGFGADEHAGTQNRGVCTLNLNFAQRLTAIARWSNFAVEALGPTWSRPDRCQRRAMSVIGGGHGPAIAPGLI